MASFLAQSFLSLPSLLPATIQSIDVFQGLNSVGIYLDSTNNYFDIRSITPLDLTNTTFLELDFKSSINFNIGIVVVNGEFEQKEQIIQLYQTDNWKKIYLDLEPFISSSINTSTFKIYFEGLYSNHETTNSVYLDNLKLVFFE